MKQTHIIYWSFVYVILPKNFSMWVMHLSTFKRACPGVYVMKVCTSFKIASTVLHTLPNYSIMTQLCLETWPLFFWMGKIHLGWWDNLCEVFRNHLYWLFYEIGRHMFSSGHNNRAFRCVTIHAETPRNWSWLGTAHKNNILTTDDSCSFRLSWILGKSGNKYLVL